MELDMWRQLIQVPCNKQVKDEDQAQAPYLATAL
jgi:hypothetical protein